jgi:hypothetical protein
VPAGVEIAERAEPDLDQCRAESVGTGVGVLATYPWKCSMASAERRRSSNAELITELRMPDRVVIAEQHPRLSTSTTDRIG